MAVRGYPRSAMNETWSEVFDAKGTRLRRALAAVEAQLSCLSREATAEEHRAAMGGLRASWTSLVELLDLGPAPELRECPDCKHIGMRGATRCGYCWATLSPLPASEDAAQ